MPHEFVFYVMSWTGRRAGGGVDRGWSHGGGFPFVAPSLRANPHRVLGESEAECSCDALMDVRLCFDFATACVSGPLFFSTRPDIIFWWGFASATPRS